jgi:1-acyl-sn-glycerol-3-phosphate acyltransferase
MDSPFTRRLVTIPVVCVLFALVTVLFPLLLPVAAVIDMVRWLLGGPRWISVRILSFGWVYLCGEVFALISLGVVGLFPRGPRVRATFSLQGTWAGWNLAAVRRLFDLEMTVEGDEAVSPGPIVVLSRHASMIDTLLPAVLITRGHGIRLRYVLKRELLVDPALDIAGNRLPNYFIDRGAGESSSERSAIRELARGLGPQEGVLIYPEGTRFSLEKHRSYTARLAGREDRVGEIARELRLVLPPRPGGTLALLDGSSADVVVLAHVGLEGFATAKDIWKGDLVGTRLTIRFWRIPRSEIPEGRVERVRWLYEVWAEVDEWVVASRGSR